MWVQSVGATRVPRAESNRPVRTNGAVVSVGGPSIGRSAEGSTAYEQPALPVTVSFSLGGSGDAATQQHGSSR